MHESRARVTCICKSLHLSPGALGQETTKSIKIINQSTHFINELLYMHYLTKVHQVYCGIKGKFCAKTLINCKGLGTKLTLDTTVRFCDVAYLNTPGAFGYTLRASDPPVCR